MKTKDCTRVFLTRGIVAHLVAPSRSANLGESALCGTSPGLIGPGSYWLGTGSYGEYERAGELPLCRRCADVVARYERFE